MLLWIEAFEILLLSSSPPVSRKSSEKIRKLQGRIDLLTSYCGGSFHSVCVANGRILNSNKILLYHWVLTAMSTLMHLFDRTYL